MNRISQQVIAAFLSQGNRAYLLAELEKRHGGIIRVYFNEALSNFSERMEREMFNSDPFTQVAEQVAIFNAQFLSDMGCSLGRQKEPIVFNISDGHCTSKARVQGQFVAQMQANDMLTVWKDRPGRQIVLRDDTDNIYDTAFGSKCGSGLGGNGPKCKSCKVERSEEFAPNTGYSGEVGSGVQFGDVSGMNMNSYYSDYMSQPFIRNLNGHGPLWGTSAYGNSIEEEDLKAFTQRTFRANEDGVENGIPKYRTWLHHRNQERDVAETLRAGGERGFIQRGHDNSTLIARVNTKRAVGQYMQGMPLRGTIAAPQTSWRLN